MIPLKKLLLLSLIASTTSIGFGQVTLQYVHQDEIYTIKNINKQFIIGIDPESGTEKMLPNVSIGPISYKVSGELPLDVTYAQPVSHYSISHSSIPYGKQQAQRLAEITIKLPHAYRSYPWDTESIYNSIAILGWVHESGIKILSLNKAKDKGKGGWSNYTHFNGKLRGKQIEGYPALWLLKENELLIKKDISPVENVAFNRVEASELKNFNAKDVDLHGNTALHLAALNGHVDLVKAILDTGKIPTKVINNNGDTPLAVAASNGRAAIVDLLIAAKSPINPKNDYFQTPIVLAAKHGYREVVDLLIDAGAEYKKGGLIIQGSAPLIGALEGNHQEVAIDLLDKNARIKLRTKDAEVATAIKPMVAGYPDLGFALAEHLKLKKYETQSGFNFFHAAASYADAEVLDRILMLGLDPAKTTETGLAPLDFAIENGNVPAICWFNENGGNVIRDENHKIDPILHATTKDQIDSVKCLIDYGIDINKQTPNGMTPLMVATYRGNKAIAETLAEAGGAWENKSQLAMDICLTRAIEMDSVILPESAIQQGFKPETPLFDDWNITTIANYYKATSILETYGDTVPAIDDPFISSKSLDAKLQLVKRSNIKYPEKLQKENGNVNVNLSIGIDKNGIPRFIKVDKSIDRDIQNLVRNALSSWQFSTPLKDGEPVATVLKMRLPLKTTSLEERALTSNELDIPPSNINQERPAYPAALQHEGIPGSVTMAWIITPQGNCENITVIDYSHIAFTGLAYDSIKNSKFKPGIKNGKPVATRVRQTISFNP